MSFPSVPIMDQQPTDWKVKNSSDWLSSSTASRLERVNDADWVRSIKLVKRGPVHAHEWHIECAAHGNEILRTVLEVTNSKRGGVPVLRGTRFTASQALAEIAESGSLSEVASDFELDQCALKQLLNGLSLIFDRPFPE